MRTTFNGWASRIILPATALFAFARAITRACLQSITIDEADTYLAWVAPASPMQWYAAANNHILNSMLIRLSTAVLGASPLTLRLPALSGAAVYIAAVYCLCRMLTGKVALQWPLFVGLVYNPLIFDFLVAARGYSLALAFLMSAIAIAACAQLGSMRGNSRWTAVEAGAACSTCVALSFAANFSFGFVDAAALLMIFVWFWRSPNGASLRLMAACIAPGLLVSLLLVTPVLHWPSSQFQFGATSLLETMNSIVKASLYQLNPEIVNPLLLGWLSRPKHYLFPLLATAAIWQWVLVLSQHGATTDVHAAWLRAFGGVLGATAALTMGAHWLALRLFGLPLPKDRTAIYLVPLFMLSIGIAAALSTTGWSGGAARRAVTILLFAVAFYFFGCLRLSYFKEWQWGADVKKAYPVLAYYNRTYGVRDFVSNWKYGAALNFYRIVSGSDSIATIRYSNVRIPSDGLVYVLDRDFDEDLIKQQHLRVVYQGESTHLLVAIRPEVEASGKFNSSDH